MEQWVAPNDDLSSPEGSPRMRRTQRVLVNKQIQIFSCCFLLLLPRNLFSQTTFQPRPTNASISGSSQRIVTSETQYSEQRTMKYQSGDNAQWYSQNHWWVQFGCLSDRRCRPRFYILIIFTSSFTYKENNSLCQFFFLFNTNFFIQHNSVH